MKSFINYLNKYKYTSVVAHLLDMVPPATLKQLSIQAIRSISESDWYFSDAFTEKKDYDVASNIASNAEIKVWLGGIRRRLFRINALYLTKHPFNFGDGKLAILSNHIVGNRRVADMSALLIHYKFVGDFHARTKNAVANKNFYRDSIDYKHYLEAIEKFEDLYLALPECHRYIDHEGLRAHGLFEYTDQYLKLIEQSYGI